MERLIFKLLLLLIIPFNLFSQDDEKNKVLLVREITPENKVESYIEIRDSAITVIEALKEKWGDEQEVNGKIEWINVSIDSIDAKIRVILYHGFTKKNNSFFKVYPISKKERSDDVRLLRLRFLQNDKDLLTSTQTTAILKRYMNNILSDIMEGEQKYQDDD